MTAIQQAAVDGERSKLLVEVQLALVVLTLTLHKHTHALEVRPLTLHKHTRPGSTHADPAQAHTHALVSTEPIVLISHDLFPSCHMTYSYNVTHAYLGLLVSVLSLQVRVADSFN